MESSGLRYEQVLQNLETKLGPYHPDTLNATNSLAQVFTKQNKIDLAEALTRKALLGRITTLAHEINGEVVIKQWKYLISTRCSENSQ